MAGKYVIRNYGTARQIPYKGKYYTINGDGAIETDDEGLTKAAEAMGQMHVTVRSTVPKAVVADTPPPTASADSSELPESLEELTVKKLKALAALRGVEVPTSVKKKADLIELLLKEN